MNVIPQMKWHGVSPAEAIQALGTHHEKGLDAQEVGRRQESFGPNSLTAQHGPGPLIRFLKQFQNPLVYILMIAGAVTAFLQEWVDAGVIFGVVLANTVIGFIQEAKAEEAIESLRKAAVTGATVIRGGERKNVPARELVPGDLVWLESGDKVPADLLLFKTRQLRVDESALTGESLAVQKAVGPLPEDTVLADRVNMAYSGSLVVAGRGQGVVVAIGDGTETGKISRLISEAVNLQTPLTLKIAAFSRLLLWSIMGLAGMTFVVGVMRKESVIDMFMASVALAVGMIPEGLPAAVSITLAIGVHRMAKRRAIIRKLPAVETLGSTTIICTDKTGTLTENQMTVQVIMAGGKNYTVEGLGYAPIGVMYPEGKSQAIDLSREPALEQCLLAGMLCNDSQLLQENGQWRPLGDPTEAALLASAAKAGLQIGEVSARFPRVDAIPFESERQYMATLHDTGQHLPNIVYVKGSVEKILAHCDSMLDFKGQPARLDAPAMLEKASRLAGQGLRVLALARKEIGNTADRLECLEEEGDAVEEPFCRSIATGLTFVGLQAMLDPPRSEAIHAVAKCREAGIQVKMITGDHVSTASIIAEKIGLAGKEKIVALTGRELAAMNPDAFSEAARSASVFARVTPEQKLRLVEALQAQGQIVAMTGDGVNDAPALKQANIGVAMGRTGTEVAKEAADMVLTDDNFASIENAVEEGRGVFDNLTKFIIWTLPTNLGEGLLLMAAIVFGLQLPILPVHALWINMATAVLLGMALAFEPKEPGIMQRQPRDPRQSIISRSMIVRLLIVGVMMLTGGIALFEWEMRSGQNIQVARTAVVNLIVMIEIFYLFNCRSLNRSFLKLGFFSNPLVIFGAAAMLAAQMLFTYAPFMQTAFHSQPIAFKDWVLILGISWISSLSVGMHKWMVRIVSGNKG